MKRLSPRTMMGRNALLRQRVAARVRAIAKHDDDARWMRRAMVLARRAARLGEVPVGAVLVHEGRVIGEGFNQREMNSDPIAHAEITAIQQGARSLGDWRMNGCVLYVTLEPCPMCAGAIVNARIGRLVYGTRDPKMGAVNTLYEICTDRRLNHRVQVTGDVLSHECGGLLKAFFQARRASRSRSACVSESQVPKA